MLEKKSIRYLAAHVPINLVEEINWIETKDKSNGIDGSSRFMVGNQSRVKLKFKTSQLNYFEVV